MRLGISSYAFTWAIGVPGRVPDAPMDAPALLAKAQALGLGVVQIADNLPPDRLSDAELAWTLGRSGTQVRRVPPPHYAWADERYDLVHSSIVPCCADLLRSLQSGKPAETSGEDNLRTMELVFAAYESAASGRAVDLAPPGGD